MKRKEGDHLSAKESTSWRLQTVMVCLQCVLIELSGTSDSVIMSGSSTMLQLFQPSACLPGIDTGDVILIPYPFICLK
jgi:hypothetical protein